MWVVTETRPISELELEARNMSPYWCKNGRKTHSFTTKLLIQIRSIREYHDFSLIVLSWGTLIEPHVNQDLIHSALQTAYHFALLQLYAELDLNALDVRSFEVPGSVTCTSYRSRISSNYKSTEAGWQSTHRTRKRFTYSKSTDGLSRKSLQMKKPNFFVLVRWGWRKF